MSRKDGSIIDVHIHAVATCDDNGVPQYGLAFVDDVTERKRTANELRVHREHLEELVKERTRQLNERVAEAEKPEQRAGECDGRSGVPVMPSSKAPVVHCAVRTRSWMHFPIRFRMICVLRCGISRALFGCC